MAEINDSASDFARKLSGFLPITPFWSAPTAIPTQVQSFASPGRVETINTGVNPSSWKLALSKAVDAVNPFIKYSSTAEVFASETQKIGDAGAEVLKSAAKTTAAAGSGLFSGFRWVGIALGLAVAFYVFLLVRPFLPSTPRSA